MHIDQEKRLSDNELVQNADIPLLESSGGHRGQRNNAVIMQEFREDQVSEEHKKEPEPQRDFLPPISPRRGNIMASNFNELPPIFNPMDEDQEQPRGPLFMSEEDEAAKTLE